MTKALIPGINSEKIEMQYNINEEYDGSFKNRPQIVTF